MKIKRLRRQETPRIVGDDSARSEPPTEVADSNNFKSLLKEKRLKEQTKRGTRVVAVNATRKRRYTSSCETKTSGLKLCETGYKYLLSNLGKGTSCSQATIAFTEAFVDADLASPTAFSELHALLSDHDYMLGKTHAPAPSNTSSFVANYAVGSPSMLEARQAQTFRVDAQL
ncbi:hypothetical protein Tco_1019220 [Tanacetum coccineum]|uniref:Uncharacterized protein n=1 Tax=Tanacetum coccineum TaxID=301880 RepID=A0ABQ5FY02_9ASTR